MAWLLVVVAGLLETGFAVSLKASDGFFRLVPSCSPREASPFSAWALRSLPVGSAYAVWTGIGAAGTAIVGIVFLGEGAQTLKLVSIALVIAGVVGLQLSGTGE